MSKSIEQLCRPVLLLVCQMRRRCTTECAPSEEEFITALNRCLDDIRSEAQKDPALNREYERIEKVLFFFVDYIVTAGPFPFAQTWRPLARKYKELSGDEKFFEMLSNAIEDPDSDALLEEYFYMMALGFSGVHSSDPAFIERKMKVCLARFAPGAPAAEEPLTPIPELPQKEANRKHFFRSVRGALLISVLIFVITALGNLVVFYLLTNDFRKTLDNVELLSATKYALTDKFPKTGVKK